MGPARRKRPVHARSDCKRQTCCSDSHSSSHLNTLDVFASFASNSGRTRHHDLHEFHWTRRVVLHEFKCFIELICMCPVLGSAPGRPVPSSSSSSSTFPTIHTPSQTHCLRSLFQQILRVNLLDRVKLHDLVLESCSSCVSFQEQFVVHFCSGEACSGLLLPVTRPSLKKTTFPTRATTIAPMSSRNAGPLAQPHCCSTGAPRLARYWPSFSFAIIQGLSSSHLVSSDQSFASPALIACPPFGVRSCMLHDYHQEIHSLFRQVVVISVSVCL